VLVLFGVGVVEDDEENSVDGGEAQTRRHKKTIR